MKTFLFPVAVIVAIMFSAAAAPACDGVQAFSAGCHTQQIRQQVVQQYAVQQLVAVPYVQQQVVVQKVVAAHHPQRIVQRNVQQRSVTRQRMVVRTR